MFKLYNGLYGNPDLDAKFSRVGSDSELNFEKNISLQPTDWLYRSKEVTYKRNSFGHRCVEWAELGEQFLLFVGCSITEGISVSLEDTYPYKVASNLGLSYYNLSINGFGPDMISLNLSNWFKHIGLKPTAVVIQWPQVHRKFERVNDEVIPLGPWHDKSDSKTIIPEQAWLDYSKVITTDYMDHYYSVLRDTTLNYLRYIDVNIVELFPNDIVLADRGRDLTHPGIESHQLLTDKVLRSFGR